MRPIKFTLWQVLLAWVFVLVLSGCESVRHRQRENIQFMELMTTLKVAWSTQDTDLALTVFDEHAIYMEPPDIQIYRGHLELRPYFDAIAPGTTMEFHNLFYNPKTKVGAGEFSFGHQDSDRSDVGVIVVELQHRKIGFWREYHRKGPADFSTFISTDEKNWKWHIGNYP